MSKLDAFVNEYNIFFGIFAFIIGLILFLKEGRNLVNYFIDEDYILASFSIQKFGAGIMFLIMGFFLLNKDLDLL